jgi:probable F420-dependent oxidoreductase
VVPAKSKISWGGRRKGPRSSSKPRPFRFSASAGDPVSGRKLAERARQAESLGYSVLVFSDHLLDQPAPVPAMATVAAATERLRVGTFVFNNDLRHPAVLAQELASLDVLSEGRLEIGLGAGWNRPEYEQSGILLDPIGTRISRMEEALTVLKGLFAEGPFSFQGEHYTITAMDGGPKPVQKPHPPLLVGGGGRRVLRIAAREAQIVGLAPRAGGAGGADIASALLPATEEKVGWIREAAGDRLAELEINTYPSLGRPLITDDDRPALADLAARLASQFGIDLKVEDLRESPHVFIGSVDYLVEKFRRLRETLGISQVMVGPIDVLASVVERLAGT